ncbi:MAG: PDGLE domain-containing protein [Methanomethylovorans sp.]|jgi:cobalt/nickel transport protein|nr:PDGLE domain-containing protein [Methanomethylovorans sp.]
MSKNINASSSNTKFLYAGVIIALLLAILSPFLASSDPDGLESAAEGVINEEKLAELEEAAPAFSSPIPDYSIEGMGKAGEVVAIVVGTLLVLAISYGLGKIIKNK